jgi:hypothetical protein
MHFVAFEVRLAFHFLIADLMQCLQISLGIEIGGEYGGTILCGICPFLGKDSLPHLPTMDRDIGIDLEAEPHPSAMNLKHGDFEHPLEAVGSTDRDRFVDFSRQNQHG